METLILDIETGGAAGPLFDYEKSLVKPHALTKDPIKKARQVQERSAKLHEEAALLDCSPIILIGTVSSVGTVIFMACKNEEINFNVQNVTILPCFSERGMLLCFSHFLSTFGRKLIFAGHHIETRGQFKGFDLPHIRFRFAVHGIRLPDSIHPFRTSVIDTMSLYWKSSNTKDPFVSLEVIGRKLNIIAETFPISGGEVPGLWARGDKKQCILKNLYDLRLTEQVYTSLGV
jgi:hypothetical protein